MKVYDVDYDEKKIIKREYSFDDKRYKTGKYINMQV